MAERLLRFREATEQQALLLHAPSYKQALPGADKLAHARAQQVGLDGVTGSRRIAYTYVHVSAWQACARARARQCVSRGSAYVASIPTLLAEPHCTTITSAASMVLTSVFSDSSWALLATSKDDSSKDDLCKNLLARPTWLLRCGTASTAAVAQHAFLSYPCHLKVSRCRRDASRVSHIIAECSHASRRKVLPPQHAVPKRLYIIRAIVLIYLKREQTRLLLCCSLLCQRRSSVRSEAARFVTGKLVCRVKVQAVPWTWQLVLHCKCTAEAHR
jgi:hypothetical protein